jgi:hypothetical protein
MANLAPVYAVPILIERSVDLNTVKGSMNNTDGMAGSITDARANTTMINASMGNISQLGIDTSAMESVLSGARSRVLNPLKSALIRVIILG